MFVVLSCLKLKHSHWKLKVLFTSISCFHKTFLKQQPKCSSFLFVYKLQTLYPPHAPPVQQFNGYRHGCNCLRQRRSLTQNRRNTDSHGGNAGTQIFIAGRLLAATKLLCAKEQAGSFPPDTSGTRAIYLAFEDTALPGLAHLLIQGAAPSPWRVLLASLPQSGLWCIAPSSAHHGDISFGNKYLARWLFPQIVVFLYVNEDCDCCYYFADWICTPVSTLITSEWIALIPFLIFCTNYLKRLRCPGPQSFLIRLLLYVCPMLLQLFVDLPNRILDKL